MIKDITEIYKTFEIIMVLIEEFKMWPCIDF